MNCKRPLQVIVLIFLASAVLPALGGNVLSNPGFEYDAPVESQNIVGWNWFGQSWGNTFTEYGSNAHTGSNYFKVFQGFTGYVNYNGIYQDYISGPGATYTADGWIKSLSSDPLAGQNLAWIEVTFRDAQANILAVYRSANFSSNTAQFPLNTWINLVVTNQLNIDYTGGKLVHTLVAPAGTYFVRLQATLQGDAAGSNGSVYFDDFNLNLTSPSAYGNWNITWSDEFNGTNINTNNWTYDLGNGAPNYGWGNSELEYYTSRTNNAFVAGGLLHIVARQESLGGANYTSARMKSLGLASWTFGRIEWRASLPNGVGFWPALWMMGTDITNVNWPGCGEIDVVENNGATPNFSQGSVHYDVNAEDTGIYNVPNGGTLTNFHVYDLDWVSNSVLWYVDGHLYEMQTNWYSSLGYPYPAPFDRSFFILMNLAVGGNYVGNPTTNQINQSVFPAELQVDYVRVYNQTAPLTLSVAVTNKSLRLSWPTNIVSHLQAQINTNSLALGTNWIDLAQTNNPIVISPTNKSTFYRLKSP